MQGACIANIFLSSLQTGHQTWLARLNAHVDAAILDAQCVLPVQKGCKANSRRSAWICSRR